MQKWKKILFSFGLACSITFVNIPNFVYADWNHSVYEEKNENYIGKGIKHEQIRKFTDNGWVNINVIRVNLDDKDTNLDLLFHQNGLNKKARLSELVGQRENMIGAINGDFFSMKTAATIGPMVKDGELLTTTSYTEHMVPTFNLTKENNPFIQNWANSKITLTNENTGFELSVLAVNKESDYENTCILYTSKWGEKTPALSSKLTSGIELIIEDHKIKNMVQAGTGSYIPNNGYVLFAAGQKAVEIGQNFVVGDSIDFSAETNPDFSDLALTVAGGSIIVKDGDVMSDYYMNIKGKHPRTALGISRDEREVFFVTIDGRTKSFTGVRQDELAQIMISLGAYNAINFDGGGSTDMVLRPLGEENKKVINHPSGGSERRIMNGIGAISNAPKVDEIGGIILEAKDENMLMNTSKQFTLKAYDKNYNPIVIDSSQVKWMVSGVKGEFNNNSFKGTTSGVGVIAVEYEGKYASLPIRVIDNPVSLKVFPSKIYIDKNKKKLLKVKVMDKDGYGATVNMNELYVDIPSNLGMIDSEGYFQSSNESGSGLMKVSFGGLSSFVPVVVGSEEEIVDDFEDNNGSFLSYPAEVTGEYDLAEHSKMGKLSGKLSYDFTSTDATRAAYLVFDDGGINFNKVPEKIGMWVYGNESGHMLKAKVVNGDGNSTNITLAPSIDWEGWKFVETAMPKTINSPFKLERIYVVETNTLSKDIGEIYMDDLTAFYPNKFTGSIPKAEEFVDSRNKKSDLRGNSSFRLFVSESISINPLGENGVAEKIAKFSNEMAEMNLFTKSIDPIIKDKFNHSSIIAGAGYGSSTHKNTLFINLDNRKGGLRETNFEQWGWFLKQMENVESKNVFVTLPKPLNFKDPLEEKLFKDTLEKLKTEKNVDIWVVTGENELFSVYPEDGVHYMNLNRYTVGTDLDQFTTPKMILFTVNDDEVTYEILSLDEK
ncbi:phosphodiester glycosidase family protein [Crassaminicella profunda]|uniref:phosphodiester glycosidase family protein n=1 Tax=Crassaminicella profunda TaxID=1286698 RepID=UPI001CA6437F|nr:phosphodiester glycosidase family protein [Crassaminicella profunda]QZY55769.1 phosphodiester glycosidase family protein [Crassaminicella profunda]